MALNPYGGMEEPNSWKPYCASEEPKGEVPIMYNSLNQQPQVLNQENDLAQEYASSELPASQTNLIINYIPQGMTEDNFRMLFQTIGPLKNCKICRNKVTGWSYGFGFVDYFTAEDAQKAIDKLNGHQVENKRLKVAFSRPGAEVNKGGNLYLRNLPKLTNENQLKNAFEIYGNIVNCRVLRDKGTGLCNGTGFVLFNKKLEAQGAMDAMSGKFLEGSTDGLVIRFADDNSQKLRAPNKTYVPAFLNPPHFPMSGPGPIRPSTNRFQARFNPMGGNLGAPIPQQPNMRQASEVGGFTLYVYNVGFHPNEQNLAALFSKYGVVNKVDIIWDWQKNQSKGFAFVSMATREAAQLAIDNLNGYQLYNRPLQVSFYAGKGGKQ